MKTAADQPVLPDEEAKRIAEYRRLGFERRATPQVVYQPPQHLCPWPGCEQRIDGINFQLEKWNTPADLDRLLDSWWRGPGLLARCPTCGQYVLFGLGDKKALMDPASSAAAMLPDDWAEKAHLVFKPNGNGC